MLTKKDKFLANAQKHLEKGSLEKALGEFQRAAQEDPKDTRTWLRIAEIHVKRGEEEQATQVYLKTADLYVEQGFFQRAVAVYKNVLKLLPAAVDVHFKLAGIHKQLGLFSDASQQYELAANLLQKEGRIKDAMAALAQMVELNPEQVVTRIKLAELASQGGFSEDAIREFKKAAEQLEGQGRIEEHLRVAERLLYHQPDNLELAKTLAIRYLERKNARFALAKLQLCFNASPKDPEILGLLATAFEQLGQVQKTVSVLKELAAVHEENRQTAERNLAIQRILALDPNDADALALSARISYVGPSPKLPPPRPQPDDLPRPVRAGGTAAAPNKGEFGRQSSITFSEIAAVPQYVGKELSTRTLAQMPGAGGGASEVDRDEASAEVQRIITEADVFVKYGLCERAADHLRKVFELSPGHIGARERLAAVLVQLGRNRQAVAELETLGEQLLATDPEEAGKHVRRALELDSRAEKAHRLQARLQSAAARGDTPEPDADGEPEAIETLEIEAVPEPIEDTGPVLDLVDSVSYDDVEVSLDSGAIVLHPPESEQVSELELEPDPEPDPAFEYEPAPELAPDPEPPAVQFEPSHETQDSDALFAEPTRADEPLSAALLSDLEQIDFFFEQGLWDEARGLLEDVHAAHGDLAPVTERLARLAALVPPSADSTVEGEAGGPSDTGAIPVASYSGEGSRPVSAPNITPRAVVAGGGGADLATHGDLGIAYKEMGLFDAAIQEFSFLANDPTREVFALTMIGECYEAKGTPADALMHYKKALNRPGVKDEETTQLYFQLGRVFQTLGDSSEALYFFDKVVRRNPKFQDVAARIVALRAQEAAAAPRAPSPDRAGGEPPLPGAAGGRSRR